MWNNSTLQIELNRNIVNKLKKYATVSGIIFIILGTLGIFFPTFMSISTVLLVSYLMLFAGISSGVFTWMSNKKDWAGWLKTVLLIGAALIMIFYPMQGVATLGLVFAIYFFMDAFAGFGLAFSLKDDKHWWLWLINAITSLILGVLFIVGWPLTSLWLVGLFVGISLLFDGVALLVGGAYLEEIDEEVEEKTEKVNEK
jgi:uncharacterized membrane protein HdeD (DUF308 family)